MGNQENGRPRTEISLMLAQFDKLAGRYPVNGSIIYLVSRRGDHHFAGPLGRAAIPIYPDSANELFLSGLSIPAQFTFTTDATGRVTGTVLQKSGAEIPAPRIADAEGKAAMARCRHAPDARTPARRGRARGLFDGR